MTNRDFDRAYDQHVAEFEGEDDDLSTAFDNFLIQDDEDNNDFDLLPRGKTEIEFITFDRDAPIRTSIILTTELYNRSFLYHMTEQGPGHTDKDIVDTFTNKATLRYDSN